MRRSPRAAMKTLYLAGLGVMTLGAAAGRPLAVHYGMTLAVLGVFSDMRREGGAGSRRGLLGFGLLWVLLLVFTGTPPVGALILGGAGAGFFLMDGINKRSRLCWRRAEEERAATALANETERRGWREAEVGRNEALRALISARAIEELPGLLARHAARFTPPWRGDEAIEAALEAVRPLLDQAGLVFLRLRRIKEQQEISRRDWLTGLPNRRALDERLVSEEKRCAALGMELARLMIDIDRFKRINDLHGHAIGDQTLILLARHLGSLARRTDFTARYGGEEFAMLLPETPLEAAVILAERLRAKLREAPLQPAGLDRPISVTVSIGVSRRSLAAADAALYRAKESGRDRVVADNGAEPLPE